MAYSFASASSQWISATAPVTSNKIVTLALWLNSTRTTPYEVPMSIADSSSDLASSYLQGDTKLYMITNSDGDKFAVSTNTKSTNQWVAACGVSSATNSRAIYLNGAKDTNSTSATEKTTLNRLGIGAFARLTLAGYFNGSIAEAAVWNVALTDAEATSLYKGFKPPRIRPQSLVFYAPLIRNLQDVSKGGRSLTNNNTATVANHPRVY